MDTRAQASQKKNSFKKTQKLFKWVYWSLNKPLVLFLAFFLDFGRWKSKFWCLRILKHFFIFILAKKMSFLSKNVIAVFIRWFPTHLKHVSFLMEREVKEYQKKRKMKGEAKCKGEEGMIRMKKWSVKAKGLRKNWRTHLERGWPVWLTTLPSLHFFSTFFYKWSKGNVVNQTERQWALKAFSFSPFGKAIMPAA